MTRLNADDTIFTCQQVIAYSIEFAVNKTVKGLLQFIFISLKFMLCWN